METSFLKTAVVIIPTHNEADSINELTDCIVNKIFPDIKNWNMKLLIVDGSSTDGTSEITLKNTAKYNNVFLIQETKKEGIGSAYLKGFTYAVNNLKADAVFEFDGDFQHPPETIPVMINKIDEGYDYVLGSRKIEGGSEFDRALNRKLLTTLGSFMARLILFFPGKYFKKVTDPTTGLKVTRVKGFLDKIDLNKSHLFSTGFGYKLQLLSEILMLGAKYTEIPLKFQKRKGGKSKFIPSTIIETLMSCFKTRIYRTIK